MEYTVRPSRRTNGRTLAWYRFSDYLKRSGADEIEVLSQQNRVSWHLRGGVHFVVLRGQTASSIRFESSGKVATEIHRAFMEGRNAFLPAKARPAKMKPGQRCSLVEDVLKRDGADCWYCARPMAEDVTIEHLIALSLGGSNHPVNIVLAHARCNTLADSMSLREKIDLRESLRESDVGEGWSRLVKATVGEIPAQS